MAKPCPQCSTQNEVETLRCQCGFIFVKEVEASQSRGFAPIRHFRRNQTIRKITVIFSTVTIFATFAAAYFGGFLRKQVAADTEAEPRPLIVKLAKDVNQPTTPNLIFPENNVPYKVTKVFTGSVIGVTDANNLEHRVTLLGIRAPKLDENFGLESREFLSNLIVDKFVIVKLRGSTKEAETIAEVLSDGTNVGLQQLQQGMGLLALEGIAGLSEDEQRPYVEAAMIAKNAKYGVWSDKKEVGPLTSEITGAPIEKNLSQTGGINRPLSEQPPIKGSVERSVDYTSVPELNAAMASEADKPKANTNSTTAENEPIRTDPGKVVAAPSPGRKYIRGPRGGCYYITSSGNKAYVDRSVCN